MLGVLAVWTFLPLAMLLFSVIRHGGVLTGTYGWDPYDELAYLAWIRDAGSHWLASDLWRVAPSAHDYLQPMFFLSGVLVRLGVDPRVAYIAWAPVSLLVLFLGCAAYVESLVAPGRARSVALALALFYASPALALGVWTGAASAAQQLDLVLTTNDAYTALNLWGLAHTAIAIGLMPVFLLAVARLIAPGGGGGVAVAVAALAGALVSWLHPWQGVELLGTLAGLVVLRGPRRRYVRLTVPVLATIAPLAYGTLLSSYDPVWGAFEARTMLVGTSPAWALLASLGPLAAFAALGLARPRSDGDWLLLLWIASCGAVYLLVPEFPSHALSGLPVPLAVLAVRGWARLAARGRSTPALAAVALALVTLPAALHAITDFRKTLTSPARGAIRQLEVLSPAQSAALSFLAHRSTPGAVLAPPWLTMSIPGLTGRPVYDGHVMWQPASHAALASRFFTFGAGAPGGAWRRRLARDSGVGFVLADCGTPASLGRELATVARPVAAFGCVVVYEVTR